MVTVVKFGGSSLANAEQFKKVKNIIVADPLRKIVVVSAPGKRNKEDAKITDLLFLLHAHLRFSVPAGHLFATIVERYEEIVAELKIQYDVRKEFEELKKTLNKNSSEDFLASRGEYFSAKLMSAYLGFKFVDAAEVIVFNYDGTVNYDKTEENAKLKISDGENIVVPGFYGAYPNGEIKVFSRGGSDVTGAIMARSLKASMYENWTDVSGILVADPRIVNNPKKIKEITYNELRELSYMGANVLHEETIFPIKKYNIPINILNTNAPEDEGTIIKDSVEDKSNIITGIAGKKDFVSLTITKRYSLPKADIIDRVLKIYTSYDVSVEHIPTSIDSFSIISPRDEIQNKLYDIQTEIQNLAGVKEVKIDDGIALVAVVGRNMVYRPGISGLIFGVLGKNDINIKMISQGPQEFNIIVGVSNSDFEKTVNTIYDNIVK
jgi:aspartate kinase